MRNLDAPSEFEASYMPLHDRSDGELKAMLAEGALSEKRAEVAQAVLKRRRVERLKDWLSRHSWLATIVTAMGISAFLLPKPTKK